MALRDGMRGDDEAVAVAEAAARNDDGDDDEVPDPEEGAAVRRDDGRKLFVFPQAQALLLSPALPCKKCFLPRLALKPLLIFSSRFSFLSSLLYALYFFKSQLLPEFADRITINYERKMK